MLENQLVVIWGTMLIGPIKTRQEADRICDMIRGTLRTKKEKRMKIKIEQMLNAFHARQILQLEH
jgi:hypothetical protein